MTNSKGFLFILCNDSHRPRVKKSQHRTAFIRTDTTDRVIRREYVPKNVENFEKCMDVFILDEQSCYEFQWIIATYAEFLLKGDYPDAQRIFERSLSIFCRPSSIGKLVKFKKWRQDLDEDFEPFLTFLFKEFGKPFVKECQMEDKWEEEEEKQRKFKPFLTFLFKEFGKPFMKEFQRQLRREKREKNAKIQ